MKTILKPKQEKFCQVYIKTGNASEAYRQSYNAKNSTDKSIWEVSSRLLKDVKVASRINELKAIIQKKFMVSIESITNELEEARQLAMSEKQAAAAVTAAFNKAKLHGLIVDKSQISANVNVMGSIKIDNKQADFDL